MRTRSNGLANRLDNITGCIRLHHVCKHFPVGSAVACMLNHQLDEIPTSLIHPTVHATIGSTCCVGYTGFQLVGQLRLDELCKCAYSAWLPN